VVALSSIPIDDQEDPMYWCLCFNVNGTYEKLKLKRQEFAVVGFAYNKTLL